MTARPVVHHIPVCPFSQRLEILLALKGQPRAVDFSVVDVTRPRDPALQARMGRTTALPVLETAEGMLKESLVILDYLDETIGARRIRRADPFEHAVERMLIAREGSFVNAGYLFVLNQDPAARAGFVERMDAIYCDIDAFLMEHNPGGTWLFEDFGLAEVAFTPLFMRFWFLEYYEDYAPPETPDCARVRRWREACLSHPAAQQVTREEIVKLYYDYAMGVGNGGLPEGRSVSSFAFAPDWRDRPWPPRGKYRGAASDAELGLV